jgi:hypothetical protein
LNHDLLSTLAVWAVTILALGLGVLVKSSVVGRPQPILNKGVSALAPAGWQVQNGVGDLIFVSRDPFAPDVHFAVSLISGSGDRQLAQVADERNALVGRGLSGYRVLEETPLIRNGREEYKILYAFVDLDHPGMPLVVRGADYYFASGGKVLVASVKADASLYDEAMARFELFLDTVAYKPGG